MVHRLLTDTHAPRNMPTVYGADGVDLLHIKAYNGMAPAELATIAAQLGEFSAMVALLVAIDKESMVGLDLAERLDTILTKLGEK